MRTFIYKVSYVIIGILEAIHIIIYFATSALLSGHTYGPRDKYGDYARGLTYSETEAIERNELIMFVILLLLIIVFIFGIYKMEQKNPELDSTNFPTINKVLKVELVALFICIIGTVITVIHYSMYS